MKRIFAPYVYGEAPRENCYWTETCDVPARSTLDTNLDCDVAIIGGGFTGVSAALNLAQNGADVVLLEARELGWGASGRNGGFCCLGGGMASDAALDRRFGTAARKDWRQTEVAAVQHVEAFLTESGTHADTHSHGETWLAHRARDMADIDAQARRVEENYGVAPDIMTAETLEGQGMQGGFHGGMTTPIGFGLNPRKYLAGLASAATAAGARLFTQAQATGLRQHGGDWRIAIGAYHVHAHQVIIATNGYSSEDTAPWLAGRYMPGQSNVAVTAPISADAQAAQGWTSPQMCYDSRNLLHYFRLMPDNRMLFGMRGGLGASARSEMRARRRLERDFRRMFPAWSDVALTHQWSGMVCLAKNLLPFVGPVPDQPGLFCSICYHGNGVAMGSYCGALAADLAMGHSARLHPDVVKTPLRRFPLGRWRRGVMPAVYAGLMLADL